MHYDYDHRVKFETMMRVTCDILRRWKRSVQGALCRAAAWIAAVSDDTKAPHQICFDKVCELGTDIQTFDV
jgi:hypothetical protein